MSDPSQALILINLHAVDTKPMPFGPSHIEARLSTILATTLFCGMKEQNPSLKQSGFWKDNLFIITPQHLQRLSVRSALRHAQFEPSLMQVETVEKLQGKEADVVIVCYSMWRSEQIASGSEFIYDAHRINVAITRARSKCIFILLNDLLTPSPEVLNSSKATQGYSLLKHLAQTCRNNNSYYELFYPFH